VNAADTPEDLDGSRLEFADPRLLKESAADCHFEVEELFQDISSPNPKIYWRDFSTSVGGLYLCIAILVFGNSVLWVQAICLMLGTVLFFRTSAFLHEIVHRSRRQLPGFETVYNLAFGYVFLLPTFLYKPHLLHHVPRIYGTADDPESTVWSKHPLLDMFTSIVIVSAVLPVLLFLRLSFLPFVMPFLGKRVQAWVYSYASTLATTSAFERKIRSVSERKTMRRQELACSLYSVILISLTVADVLPLRFFTVVYLMMFFASSINMIRASVNHGHIHDDIHKTSQTMISDSYNVTRDTIWNWIWSPLETKYHALHHLAPSLPYHSYREAHSRALATLPASHPYHRSSFLTYPEAFERLVWNCRRGDED
jgi:fatty acid desaturase